MNLPAYSKYKPSGVEWLGEVPEHWEISPLYVRYDIKLGKMLDDSRITGSHLVPYIRNVDVQWDWINTSDLPQMDIRRDEYIRYTLRVGDLLVCEGGEVGRCAIYNGSGEVVGFQKALHRLRPLNARECVRYLFYIMKTYAAIGAFVADGNPNTIPHLTGEKLRRYRFPCPPFDEQHAIAAFLDAKTAKIDALIAKKRTLIDKLKEKRAALITHTVTRGLPPDAARAAGLDPHPKMKDSGVEWLGEVPEHWEVKRLKHLVDSIQIGPFGGMLTDGVDWPTGTKLYGQENIISGNFDIGSRWMPEDLIELKQKYGVTAGDILITRKGSLGYARIFPKNQPSGIIDSDTIRIRVNISYISSAYLQVILNESAITAFQINMSKRGAILSGINTTVIAELGVVTPPLDEQQIIIIYLDHETAKLDQMTAKVEAAIEKLQEYRSALITAAVTGKIDVREALHG